MLTLKGELVFLRALEPEDLEFLYEVENNEQFWEVSATSAPFSRFILAQYLKNSHQDIYEVKQLRLVICSRDNAPVGLIDIFDFDPRNRRAALGIIIANPQDRKKGFGAEALRLLCQYCFTHLALHQVYVNVSEKNTASIHLFENAGFVRVGEKKDWNLIKGEYESELLYQLIN